MNATSAIQRMEEAKKLPLGHVDRKKTEKAVAEIYQHCHALEKYWSKRLSQFRKNLATPKECIVFCNTLCRMLGAKTLKRVVYNSPDIIPGSAGHCDIYKKEIHLGWCAWLCVIIHELAHHVAHQMACRTDHGKDFCFVENWLFQLAYEKLTGKPPKPYWIEEAQKILENK